MAGLAPLSLDLARMQTLAARIALGLRSGDCIALSGDLGTGKTAFCRALIRSLSTAAIEVTSPTFTLMQSYPVTLANGVSETLWHLDLYRLEDANQARELGLEELWKHAVLVEWPEVISPVLPDHCLRLTFSYADDDVHRVVEITAEGTWRERLGAVW